MDKEELHAYHKKYHKDWYQRNKKSSDAQSKKWAHDNPEKQRIMMRKCRYGLSEKQQSMLAEKCEICGSNVKLVIDHDHETNTMRGVLCNGCNTGLGFFKDDVDSLRQAVKYLNDKGVKA